MIQGSTKDVNASFEIIQMSEKKRHVKIHKTYYCLKNQTRYIRFENEQHNTAFSYYGLNAVFFLIQIESLFLYPLF